MDAGDTVDATREAKRSAILKRLDERREARTLACGDSVRATTKAAHDEFDAQFEILRSNFKAAVEEASEANSESPEAAEKVEEASICLQEMQKMLNGKVAGLPAYRVQNIQMELDQRYGEVTRLRQSHMPKKRFGFKKQPGGTKPSKPTTEPKKKPIVTETHVISSESEVAISRLTNETRELSQEEVDGKDVSLSHLQNCVIRIFGTPATLHVTHVENTKILTGPVRTSIFVESCSSTEFQIACQQLRIHSSHNCRFFTFVSSRAIIEDCKDVEFAPYALNYEGIEKHFDSCGFCFEKNNWKSIDDFNWLALDKPSPNWRVIQQQDQLEKAH